MSIIGSIWLWSSEAYHDEFTVILFNYDHHVNHAAVYGSTNANRNHSAW